MAAKTYLRAIVIFFSVYVVYWIGFEAGRYAKEEHLNERRLIGNEHGPGKLEIFTKNIREDTVEGSSRGGGKMASTEVETCEPVKKIVFIKTHKTASTTLASIIERFGYTRNLSFVVPPDRKYGPHILSSSSRFTRAMLKNSPLPLNGGKYYDMLTNHVRYNRPEMDDVIPNATYVTIIRHPVKHFESAFSYFQWGRLIKDSNDKIAKFMENPQTYLDKKVYFWYQSHNGQLFDLGMDTADTNDDKKVDAYIQKLNSEMDLVLVADYFDQSLLVLKKQLCWTMDDILYIPNGVRSETQRRHITDNTRQKIVAWNKSDFKLYQHFNRTLWQKIDQYGTTFEQDLQEFRQRRQKAMNECTDNMSVLQNDPRETRYKLKANASDLCQNLWRGDVTFTALLRNRQLEGRVLEPPHNQQNN
ncbi:galactosylceramide sulfotransferase-like [Ptychodera flava]|uniref:galactosylceramide sulfotransferase-like n=1 Tax=Ptychodera flava TaxID=63121 RepID=UPI003969DA9F